MIRRITNEPRRYVWGSSTLLPDFLGVTSTGQPMAEIWFGTHPLSTARVDSGESLRSLVNHDLGFMLKFLAADSPLSIQVHPNQRQAEAGFDAEQAAQIDLNDPARNFKDRSAKREAIVAISEFDLLAGLHRIEHIRDIYSQMAQLVSPAPAALLKRYVALSESTDGYRAIIGDIFAGDHATDVQFLLLEEMMALSRTEATGFSVDWQLLRLLFEKFGTDRSILVAIIMKRIKLKPGQAVFVSSGVPHSYLSGLGIEILNTSDNVLRGGLTAKHISPTDFMAVLDISSSLKTEVVEPRAQLNGLETYEFDEEEFSLQRITTSGGQMLVDVRLTGESILVCVAGEITVSSSLDELLTIRRGEAAYLSSDANFYTFAGSGEGYLGSDLVKR